MVAQNAVRTYGLNPVFRFVEGIWLYRKSRQIRIFFGNRPILLHTCATCSELQYHTSTMTRSNRQYRVHVIQTMPTTKETISFRLIGTTYLSSHFFICFFSTAYQFNLFTA